MPQDSNPAKDRSPMYGGIHNPTAKKEARQQKALDKNNAFFMFDNPWILFSERFGDLSRFARRNKTIMDVRPLPYTPSPQESKEFKAPNSLVNQAKTTHSEVSEKLEEATNKTAELLEKIKQLKEKATALEETQPTLSQALIKAAAQLQSLAEAESYTQHASTVETMHRKIVNLSKLSPNKTIDSDEKKRRAIEQQYMACFPRLTVKLINLKAAFEVHERNLQRMNALADVTLSLVAEFEASQKGGGEGEPLTQKKFDTYLTTIDTLTLDLPKAGALKQSLWIVAGVMMLSFGIVVSGGLAAGGTYAALSLLGTVVGYSTGIYTLMHSSFTGRSPVKHLSFWAKEQKASEACHKVPKAMDPEYRTPEERQLDALIKDAKLSGVFKV